VSLNIGGIIFQVFAILFPIILILPYFLSSPQKNYLTIGELTSTTTINFNDKKQKSNRPSIWIGRLLFLPLMVRMFITTA
jgi:hypothetical protein